MTNIPHKPIGETRVDWSTPYDDWLLPILNRYRYGGAIECRAIPSEIQLEIDKLLAAQLQPLNDGELKEKLAAIEHERWSDWQLWCHQVIRQNVGRIDELEDVLARWDRQAITPYDALSDKEKASDMEQVDRYWPLIQEYIAAHSPSTEAAVLQGRIDEMQLQIEWLKSNYISKNPTLFGWGDRQKYEYCKNRIAELQAQKATLESVTTDEGDV